MHDKVRINDSINYQKLYYIYSLSYPHLPTGNRSQAVVKSVTQVIALSKANGHHGSNFKQYVFGELQLLACIK
jgi:hypothetical protein